MLLVWIGAVLGRVYFVVSLGLSFFFGGGRVGVVILGCFCCHSALHSGPMLSRYCAGVTLSQCLVTIWGGRGGGGGLE